MNSWNGFEDYIPLKGNGMLPYIAGKFQGTKI